METVEVVEDHKTVEGSYRTYEEWKHEGTNRKSRRYNSVLTVPMRNGNIEYSKNNGIELSVLTVPMRNGNKESRQLYQHMNRVLTVPMRNGNFQCV